MNPNIDKVKKALASYGIYTEKDLEEAIKNMKPLDISCMVSPVKQSGEFKKELKY